MAWCLIPKSNSFHPDTGLEKFRQIWNKYSVITSTKSPSICMTTLQSQDCNYYVRWRICHLHGCDCRSTLIYVHTTLRTLPNCDDSLGSLTLSPSEVEDFVELILLYFSVRAAGWIAGYEPRVRSYRCCNDAVTVACVRPSCKTAVETDVDYKLTSSGLAVVKVKGLLLGTRGPDSQYAITFLGGFHDRYKSFTLLSLFARGKKNSFSVQW